MGPIRAATVNDVHALAVSVASLPLLARYGQSPDRLEQALTKALERGDSILVYDDNGNNNSSSSSNSSSCGSNENNNGNASRNKLCGLAWYLTSGTFAAGGYLKLLAVCPGAQRNGVGAALLDAYEAAAFAASPHAFLLVSDFNVEAQRFYQRHGYRQVGALPGFALPDVSELIYWKPRQLVVPPAAQ